MNLHQVEFIWNRLNVLLYNSAQVQTQNFNRSNERSKYIHQAPKPHWSKFKYSNILIILFEKCIIPNEMQMPTEIGRVSNWIFLSKQWQISWGIIGTFLVNCNPNLFQKKSRSHLEVFPIPLIFQSLSRKKASMEIFLYT